MFSRLLCAGIVGPIVRGELSEEEKRKREAFLKAREEMRTVESPTPSASPKKKAKPKAATPKKKKKTTKAKPTPEEEEETPKKAKAKETPEPEETPKHKAKKSPTPKPKTTPKKEKEEEEEEKRRQHQDRNRPQTPERPSPIPRASVVPHRSPEQPADVIVQKSGFPGNGSFARTDTGGASLPLLEMEHKSRSSGHYRYLSRSVRAEIDHARVLRRRWQYIVVHNSGTRQGNARIFDYYHRHVRRMTNGLAYHFVIGNGTSSDNGEIEVGDRWRRQINGGHVHSDYLNNIALGICLVGDFNRDQPTRAQLEACEELIRYLRQRCGKIDAHYAIVRPHREMNPPRWATDCPGDAFPYSWFRRFQ